MNRRHVRNSFIALAALAALGVAGAITASAHAYWYCNVTFPC